MNATPFTALSLLAIENVLEAFQTLNEATDHPMKQHCRDLIKNALDAIGEKVITGTYQKSLSDAIEAAKNELKMKGAVLAENEGVIFSPIGYGVTLSRDYKLESFKGKQTKKWGHIVIYRMDSGNYEQTNYIL
jgi:alanine-alpha-ketoisovalerate/valine-pyruvate aminotransferase